MRFAMVTTGTRGDVQPYLHVGRALKARGHEVVLATHAEFAPLVRAAGLELRVMRGGFREMMGSELGRAWLASADRPLEYARYSKRLFLPLQQGWIEDAYAASEGCDAVLFYALANQAVVAAEQRNIPAIALSPWPALPTGRLPVPAAAQLAGLPAPLQRLAWDLLLRLSFGAMRPEFDLYRARVGLPVDPAPTPYHSFLRRRIPCVHLFSERVVPRPDDWPNHGRVAGFAFGEAGEAAAYEPPPGLEAFLAKGPVVYVGFGSMTGHSPDALANLAVGAARLAGVRLVYASGWAGSAPPASDDVFVLEECPHAWLFPRVSAVVHHGGVGTFAEGLRAGRPTVIVAFFGDQPFWGQRNASLATGPRHLTRRTLDERSLAAAITAAVHDPRHRAAAEQVARALSRENGAERAAVQIESLLGVGPARP